jgi:hypothetical protein
MWVDNDVPLWSLPNWSLTTGLKNKSKATFWNRTILNFCGIVVAILKMETGRNFSMSGINSGRWNWTMLNLCGIVVAILKMVTGRNFSMSGNFRNGRHNTAQIQHCSISTSWIDSWHRKISTGRHFQNGHHNTAKIQHCSISKITFNSRHHYLPTYQILMISDNVDFLPPIFYAVFWQPFWKWQTSRKFWKCRIATLMVTYHYVKFYIFKMATTIPHKFNIVRFQRHFIRG